MTPSATKARIELSDGALYTLAPPHIRAVGERLRTGGVKDREWSVVVGTARELLSGNPPDLPGWVDAETRYLVLLDVPTPAIMRLPAALGLHKPHQRLHTSPDRRIVKRFVLSQVRDVPVEGIVDAYVLAESLVLVLGDMTIREFPKARLPRVGKLDTDAFEAFVVDESGSFLHWPELDVHLGVSQLLQAADPMHLAEVEIQRYRREKVSTALQEMRESRGLRQSDVTGLSERHVRRLEREEARLTADAAEAMAGSFGLSLPAFFDELGRRLSRLSEIP